MLPQLHDIARFPPPVKRTSPPDVEASEAPPPPSAGLQSAGSATVYVVDDEHFARPPICDTLRGPGRTVVGFERCEAFLATCSPAGTACLVLDVNLPGMGGPALLDRLRAGAPHLPVIVVSGSSGLSVVVRTMKAGAIDVFEKPIRPEALEASVVEALAQSRSRTIADEKHDVAVEHLASLTPRQRQILALVLAGHPNKNIAADLGISRRTVEAHRASLMQRVGVNSLAALARLATAAAWSETGAAPERVAVGG